MNDGHAAGDAHDGAGTSLPGPHGWLLGAAGRSAPPGAVRRRRSQRERLRASGHPEFEVRVRPHRSPISALPRRRFLFRPWAAHWSPYGRSRQRWRHSAVALRPTLEARNRRVPADTLRDAVQSAYSHTPRAVCQHRRAADGGHTMNRRFCSLQSGQACASKVRPTPGRWYAPARGPRGITFAVTDRRQEVQMPRFIRFLVLALAIVGTPVPTASRTHSWRWQMAFVDATREDRACTSMKPLLSPPGGRRLVRDDAWPWIRPSS
jgi:hypothetical protein